MSGVKLSFVSTALNRTFETDNMIKAFDYANRRDISLISNDYNDETIATNCGTASLLCYLESLITQNGLGTEVYSPAGNSPLSPVSVVGRTGFAAMCYDLFRSNKGADAPEFYANFGYTVPFDVLTVSGAGSAAVNGAYSFDAVDLLSNIATWQKDDDASVFVEMAPDLFSTIYDTDGFDYYRGFSSSTSNAARFDPELVVWEADGDGVLPVPVIVGAYN